MHQDSSHKEQLDAIEVLYRLMLAGFFIALFGYITSKTSLHSESHFIATLHPGFTVLLYVGLALFVLSIIGFLLFL